MLHSVNLFQILEIQNLIDQQIATLKDESTKIRVSKTY